jgi:hypothetical protein
MATVGAWARHSVVDNFVIAVVGVVGSVTFDLPVLYFHSHLLRTVRGRVWVMWRLLELCD